MRALVIALGVVLFGLFGLLLFTLPPLPRPGLAPEEARPAPDRPRSHSADSGRLELPRDPSWAAPGRPPTGGSEGAVIKPAEELPRRLKVRVYGPDNRALPLARVDWVDVRDLEDPEWTPPNDPRFVTDQTGRVELEELPEGPIVLFAGAPYPPPEGVVLFAWLPYSPGPSPEAGSEPPSVELLITPHRKYRVRGRLLGADREPLIGVKLGLEASGEDDGLQRFLRPFLLEGETIRADGHFELGLVGDAPWELRFYSELGPGERLLVRRRVGRSDSDRPLEIVLDRGKTVSCRLWGSGGERLPISSHSLFWRTEGGGGGGIGFSSSHGGREAVGFVWPEGATEVRVSLSTRAGYGGPTRQAPELLLTDSRDSCEAYLGL